MSKLLHTIECDPALIMTVTTTKTLSPFIVFVNIWLFGPKLFIYLVPIDQHKTYG